MTVRTLGFLLDESIVFDVGSAEISDVAITKEHQWVWDCNPLYAQLFRYLTDGYKRKEIKDVVFEYNKDTLIYTCQLTLINPDGFGQPHDLFGPTKWDLECSGASLTLSMATEWTVENNKSPWRFDMRILKAIPLGIPENGVRLEFMVMGYDGKSAQNCFNRHVLPHEHYRLLVGKETQFSQARLPDDADSCRDHELSVKWISGFNKHLLPIQYVHVYRDYTKDYEDIRVVFERDYNEIGYDYYSVDPDGNNRLFQEKNKGVFSFDINTNIAGALFVDTATINNATIKGMLMGRMKHYSAVNLPENRPMMTNRALNEYIQQGRKLPTPTDVMANLKKRDRHGFLYLALTEIRHQLLNQELESLRVNVQPETPEDWKWAAHVRVAGHPSENDLAVIDRLIKEAGWGYVRAQTSWDPIETLFVIYMTDEFPKLSK